MAFKMKGSAFKLGNVATKSVLKQKSPMKDTITAPDNGNALEADKRHKATSTHHTNPVPMKSPLEHEAAEGEINPRTGATAKQHNKTYGTPKHHDDPRKDKRKNKMENDKIKDPVHAAMLDPETGNEESGLQMKSPLEQTSTWDKIKSAGRAVASNIGEVHGGAKGTKTSYDIYKKRYREADRRSKMTQAQRDAEDKAGKISKTAKRKRKAEKW